MLSFVLFVSCFSIFFVSVLCFDVILRSFAFFCSVLNIFLLRLLPYLSLQALLLAGSFGCVAVLFFFILARSFPVVSTSCLPLYTLSFFSALCFLINSFSSFLFHCLLFSLSRSSCLCFYLSCHSVFLLYCGSYLFSTDSCFLTFHLLSLLCSTIRSLSPFCRHTAPVIVISLPLFIYLLLPFSILFSLPLSSIFGFQLCLPYQSFLISSLLIALLSLSFPISLFSLSSLPLGVAYYCLSLPS